MRTLLPLLALFGCDADTNPNDTGAIGDDIGLPEICTTVPDGESACPVPDSPIPYSMLGPNVHLAVDRSGSMRGDKWAELQALTAYLPLVGARANLGLSLFPTPEPRHSCDVWKSRVVPVSEGASSAEQVGDWLLSTEPGGSTPMGRTLEKLVGDPGLQCPNRDNIVVLLTDGQESCGGDPVDATRALVGQQVPVELYVIGFGTDEDTNGRLAKIAQAAEPTTGPGNFYTASTTDELVARLAAVTATCTAQIDLDAIPEDLTVTLDERPLAPCFEERCEDGYTTDREHRTIRLEGEDCLALLDGACHDLVLAAE